MLAPILILFTGIVISGITGYVWGWAIDYYGEEDDAEIRMAKDKIRYRKFFQIK
jgi:hypothetical protein